MAAKIFSSYCGICSWLSFFFFFQAEDGIRDSSVTGVQTCALPILLPPTGQASPVPQPLSTPNVSYVAPTGQGLNPPVFDGNPGTKFEAFDYATGIQYMPNEQITYDLEINHRGSNVPYFAGRGGVTSPDGYVTTTPPAGGRLQHFQNANSTTP